MHETRRLHAAVIGSALLCLLAACTAPASPESGRWRAWMDSPGGELPFGLELKEDGAKLEAWITNGPERIQVPSVSFDKGQLTLELPQYDSRVIAHTNGADRLDGNWRRRTGPERWARLDFHATHGEAPRFPPVAKKAGAPEGGDIDGRWAVRFANDKEPAIGIFKTEADGSVTGTFLTTTGDYRYLAGSFSSGRLRLSCFDGSHAFLFDANLGADGTLKGDYWSRDVWHDTWTAHRDEEAKLPDGFGLTTWRDTVSLEDLSYPDLDGQMHTLADPAYDGKARLIELFGSWCSNCADASDFMVELDKKYRDRGLSVLGLAFEMTGESERDAHQARLYAERHHVKYPILLAGLADKDEASKEFPLLDRVRAFPTFIFMDGAGEVKAVYQGFSGPATGEAYERLRETFESEIEKLLGAADAGADGPQGAS